MGSEIWIDAYGFEKYYEVSSLGRVRRKPRESRNSRNRNTYKNYKEKILSLKCPKNNRYISVKLTWEGRTWSRDLHKLVLLSFTPMPFEKAVVNHKNGIKTDNRLNNLEWCTQSENVRHAISSGLVPYRVGEDNKCSKITNEIAINIRKLRLEGSSIKQISSSLNITDKIVIDVCSGRTFSHLPFGIANTITSIEDNKSLKFKSFWLASKHLKTDSGLLQNNLGEYFQLKGKTYLIKEDGWSQNT